jgi:hypothetical protein
MVIFSNLDVKYFYLFSGDVVTKECVDKLIKKDMMHPLTGEKLKDSDFIPLQRVIIIVY